MITKLLANFRWHHKLNPVIGTLYCNYHRPALILIFIFPDLLPKDLANIKSGTHMSYMDLCMPNQALQQ